MEWISVKDKLPEKGNSILAYTSTGICIAHLLGFSSISGTPEWIEQNGDYSFWNVTHWMPLPYPPEE